jgi:hypothetical protein
MTEENKDFKTHIKEPRWQQIVSIIIVIAMIVIYLLIALKHFL